MENIDTKHVIIGAGAMGSAAAYHLARRGEPVVLIEQFALGHDRGSSHGAARITRHSYADLAYARLMPAAFRAWRELEADAGETALHPHGRRLVLAAGRRLRGPGRRQPEGAGGPPLAIGRARAWNQRHPAFALARRLRRRFRARRRHAHGRARRRAPGRAGPSSTAATDFRVLDQTPVRRIDLDHGARSSMTDTARIVAERLIVVGRRLGQAAACPSCPSRFASLASKCSMCKRPIPPGFASAASPSSSSRETAKRTRSTACRSSWAWE